MNFIRCSGKRIESLRLSGSVLGHFVFIMHLWVGCLRRSTLSGPMAHFVALMTLRTLLLFSDECFSCCCVVSYRRLVIVAWIAVVCYWLFRTIVFVAAGLLPFEFFFANASEKHYHCLWCFRNTILSFLKGLEAFVWKGWNDFCYYRVFVYLDTHFLQRPVELFHFEVGFNWWLV